MGVYYFLLFLLISFSFCADGDICGIDDDCRTGNQCKCSFCLPKAYGSSVRTCQSRQLGPEVSCDLPGDNLKNRGMCNDVGECVKKTCGKVKDCADKIKFKMCEHFDCTEDEKCKYYPIREGAYCKFEEEDGTIYKGKCDRGQCIF